MFKKLFALLGQTLKGSAVDGVNYTKTLNAIGDNIVDPGMLGGRVQAVVDTYEAAALATGSTIRMGMALPKGARIVGAQLLWDALGGDATLSLGDSLSATRYIAATSAVTAGRTDALDVDGANYEVGTTSGDNVPVVTVGGSAAVTGTIKMILQYVHA